MLLRPTLLNPDRTRICSSIAPIENTTANHKEIKTGSESCVKEARRRFPTYSRSPFAIPISFWSNALTQMSLFDHRAYVANTYKTTPVTQVKKIKVVPLNFHSQNQSAQAVIGSNAKLDKTIKSIVVRGITSEITQPKEFVKNLSWAE